MIFRRDIGNMEQTFACCERTTKLLGSKYSFQEETHFLYYYVFDNWAYALGNGEKCSPITAK
jgi:hypothetical protein